ncbi:DUF2642 domain-containing protein [Paenibacillus filicis]|uniref:DUF2642 domain-containing protein n=1 Tax=Paenibacillus gyeongsangnamensis TaxID=3388067 RepID=A0ABT4QFX5_9BACL|nr:DUF2642 domain-containing protein [Paenibacillus filicis]MCZ8515790.1 DUF2642 domain-containing protein [Paenibacillus filicis]
MSDPRELIDQQVKVELSGNNVFTGKLIDLGLDLMVLFHEQRYLYIPLVHVQNLKKSNSQSNDETANLTKGPIDSHNESITLRNILDHAKGLFAEIYVTGNKSIHGYITSVMNDYFVFYSPVYKGTFVSMNHLKWLIPYHPDQVPYSLSNQSLPVNPVHIPLSRTFEEQCKRLEGNLVVFDLGDHPNKIGVLQKAGIQFMKLVNASGDEVLLGTHHLKTVYIP